MKAQIREHDEKLELVITCEDYQEHILMRAFLRENATSSFVPISTNSNGTWSVTLGSCRCEERTQAATQEVKDVKHPAKQATVQLSPLKYLEQQLVEYAEYCRALKSSLPAFARANANVFAQVARRLGSKLCLHTTDAGTEETRIDVPVPGGYIVLISDPNLAERELEYYW